MKINRIEKYFRGWCVGDFEPSILRTKDFEFGILTHKKGEIWASHYHEYITEVTYVIEGRLIIQGKELTAGDIFILHPNEIADPEFLEDCVLAVIKTPSVPGDKVLV